MGKISRDRERLMKDARDWAERHPKKPIRVFDRQPTAVGAVPTDGDCLVRVDLRDVRCHGDPNLCILLDSQIEGNGKVVSSIPCRRMLASIAEAGKTLVSRRPTRFSLGRNDDYLKFR